MNGQHGDPIGDLTGVQKEPLVLGEAVRGVLVAVVAAGWIAIPDATINLIVSAAGLVGSVITTWLTRRKVVPTAKLQ